MPLKPRADRSRQVANQRFIDISSLRIAFYFSFLPRCAAVTETAFLCSMFIALTTVFSTTVLHCDSTTAMCLRDGFFCLYPHTSQIVTNFIRRPCRIGGIYFATAFAAVLLSTTVDKLNAHKSFCSLEKQDDSAMCVVVSMVDELVLSHGVCRGQHGR